MPVPPVLTMLGRSGPLSSLVVCACAGSVTDSTTPSVRIVVASSRMFFTRSEGAIHEVFERTQAGCVGEVVSTVQPSDCRDRGRGRDLPGHTVQLAQAGP